MGRLVMDEKEWVEEVIQTHSLGEHPFVTLGRIARYYYYMGFKPADIHRRLEEHLLRSDPNVVLVKWQGAISKVIKGASKRPLIQLDGIVITQPEMAKIQQLQGRMRQRLMFTLVCIAKYFNAVNAKNDAWVATPWKDVFAMANIKLSGKRQALMLNDLLRAGYINVSRSVDNTSVRALILDDAGERALVVRSLDNLGNRYMLAVGENYFECPACGTVVRRTSHSQKYCKQCAEDINREKARNRYQGVVA